MPGPKHRLPLFAAVAVGVMTVSMVGMAIRFGTNHKEVSFPSDAMAEAEFAQLRLRFSHQQPLVDMTTRAARTQTVQPTAASPLRAFHTVILDTRGRQRLVRISVPYWFARLFARHDDTFIWLGELTFLDDTEFDPERIRLSLAQLERRGPGLVVDYRHSGGGQFISWVE